MGNTWGTPGNSLRFELVFSSDKNHPRRLASDPALASMRDVAVP